MGLQAPCEHAVYKSVIKIETFLIECAQSQRLYTRPRNREAIGISTKAFDQTKVFFPAVVVVTRMTSAITIQYLAILARKGIPN